MQTAKLAISLQKTWSNIRPEILQSFDDDGEIPDNIDAVVACLEVPSDSQETEDILNDLCDTNAYDEVVAYLASFTRLV